MLRLCDLRVKNPSDRFSVSLLPRVFLRLSVSIPSSSQPSPPSQILTFSRHHQGVVTVVGSANMDLVCTCQRLPRPGETLAGTDFATIPGGKGANQAVAIACLGGSVQLITKVGQDPFGDDLIASLTHHGVDTSRVLRDPAHPTGIAAITVESSGQNSIIVVPGANGQLTAADTTIQGDGPVLLQLEIPLDTVKAALHAAGGRLKILNPAPASQHLESILPLVDILTPNESECKTLTGIYPTDDDSCEAAGKALINRGLAQIVITLGKKGSYHYSQSGGRHFPTIEVNAVDTTAAGDAFNGAIAHFLSEGRGIDNAIALANIVGALSTTKPGAQPSMPSLQDLQTLAKHLL